MKSMIDNAGNTMVFDEDGNLITDKSVGNFLFDDFKVHATTGYVVSTMKGSSGRLIFTPYHIRHGKKVARGVSLFDFILLSKL